MLLSPDEIQKEIDRLRRLIGALEIKILRLSNMDVDLSRYDGNPSAYDRVDINSPLTQIAMLECFIEQYNNQIVSLEADLRRAQLQMNRP